MPRRQAAARRPNWKRLTIATLGIFWGLAALVLVACELVLPNLFNASTPAPSGFNYGAAFGANFFRPFGWIVAGVLFGLGPLALLVRGVDALGDRLRGWVGGAEK
jgi:hypothetical protein